MSDFTEIYTCILFARTLKCNERVERSASQLFGHVGVSHIRCELEMCRKADVITEEPEFQSGMVKAINLKVN